MHSAKKLSNVPVWMAGKTVNQYPKLTAAAHYDVAVIGGGIFGVTAAYLLKLAGKKVALIESRTIGSGTTGCSTAKLTAQHGLVYKKIASKYDGPTAKLYGEMQIAAMKEAERLVAEHKIDCEWMKKDAHVWATDDKMVEELKAEGAACAHFGWPVETIDPSASDLPASIGAKAVLRWKDQVAFNPFAFCQGLAAKVDGGQGAVFENTRVDNVSDLTSLSHHTITIADAPNITASKVVIATHLPILDISCHFAFLPPSRDLCVLVKLSSPIIQGMYISAEHPVHSVRPIGDGTMVMVCGEEYTPGSTTAVKEKYAALEAWARAHLPVAEVLGTWSAEDFMSGDHMPYIGFLHHGTKSIFTATGFSKWGLSNGVAAAMLVRDLITEKENPYTNMVDARRWKLLQTGSSFLEENKEVTKHFIGDKLKALVAPHISTLKPGEGGLVKADKHGTVGAYLDENSKWHIVKPICTHLGCHLQFNNGDLCWDCPCHGSRFGVDGEVLHGPACKNLQLLEW